MTDQIEDWLSGGPALLRVYEINERAIDPNGLPLTVVSLERWEDSVRLVYAHSVLDRMDPDPVGSFEAWTIDDGRGTQFEFKGGGGGGDGVRFYENFSWSPGPAGDALEISIENAKLGINVTVSL